MQRLQLIYLMTPKYKVGAVNTMLLSIAKLFYRRRVLKGLSRMGKSTDDQLRAM